MARTLVNTIEAQEVSKTQTKILSADVTATGIISDLTFNNLEIGKWYKVILNASLTSINADTRIQVKNSSSILNSCILNGPNDVAIRTKYSLIAEFQAIDSTLICEAIGIDQAIEGDGTKDKTFVTLSEANGGELQTTTDFT